MTKKVRLEFQNQKWEEEVKGDALAGISCTRIVSTHFVKHRSRGEEKAIVG